MIPTHIKKVRHGDAYIILVLGRQEQAKLWSLLVSQPIVHGKFKVHGNPTYTPEGTAPEGDL